MSRRGLVSILLFAVILFGAAFYFYGEAQKQQREADAMRELQLSLIEPVSDVTIVDPMPESERAYDPTNLDHTPPGLTPFVPSNMCYTHWGLQIRQYCEDGDEAVLDIVEGDSQPSAMADHQMCLNEMIQNIDAYDKPDMRPMDCEIPLNEASRRALACDMVARYGDSPVFDRSGVGTLIKEHVESGHIRRIENR